LTMETSTTLRYLPKIINGHVVLTEEQSGTWRVTQTSKLVFRASKNLDDGMLECIERGLLVDGVDEGDGWVRCQISKEAAVELPKGDLEYEIEAKTAWGSHLDASISLTTKQIDNHEVWLVDNLLSASECSVLLKLAESHGFGRTSYPKAYRGNLRLITTDPSLSEVVWRRLEPLVPTTLTLDGEVWDACGLNECWRLAKYHPGDVFKGHCDACFDRHGTDPPEMSMLTVNIYMNGGFQGGRTRFYFDRGKEADRSSAFAVTPDTGLCLLFRQPPGKAYYHDGEELGSGVKYLFRSDVMYRLRK